MASVGGFLLARGFCSLFFLYFGFFAASAGGRVVPSEIEAFDVEKLAPYDGRLIEAIHIHGLRHTKEAAVRWLLGGKVGKRFDADAWVYGIRKLYDTAALYDIVTKIAPLGKENDSPIEIDLSLKDKWTLLPYFKGQGNGSTAAFMAGIYNVNVAGLFMDIRVGGSYFNNEYGYDVNVFQEWIADTDYMASIDVARAGTPVDLYTSQDNPAGSFVWRRDQHQLMMGRRIGRHIRLFCYLEHFNDTMVSMSPGTVASLYTGDQYRLRPVFILGRVDLTNFLEHGHELTISPSTANFFEAAHVYNSLIASFKRVDVLDGNSSFAYLLSAGVMSSAPLPYLFNLGGLYTVRGFATQRFFGTSYVNANVEYRPFLWMQRFDLLGIDKIALQGAVFTDVGGIWNSSGPPLPGSGSSLGLWSAGVGIRLNFVKLANSLLRLDVARTITPDEGFGVSFGVGQFF